MILIDVNPKEKEKTSMYDPVQALAQQIGQAKPKYNPWLEEGNHTLAVSQVRYDGSTPAKPTIYVDFIYITSDTQPLGSPCSQSYRLYEHGTYPGGTDDALTNLKHFTEALSGDNDAAAVGRYSNAMIGQNAARGILIKCIARDSSKGQLKKDGTPKKRFVSPTFSHHEGQLPEAIQAMRTYLDTVSPEKAAQPVAAPQPQPFAQPQPYNPGTAAQQQFAQQPFAQTPQQFAQGMVPPQPPQMPAPQAPAPYQQPQVPAPAPQGPQMPPQGGFVVPVIGVPGIPQAPLPPGVPTPQPVVAVQVPQAPVAQAAPAPGQPQAPVALGSFPIPGL